MVDVRKLFGTKGEWLGAEYLKEKGYEDKVLIAFSGSKNVDGHTYTVRCIDIDKLQ